MSQKSHTKSVHHGKKNRFSAASLLLLGGIGLIAVAVLAAVWITLTPSTGGGSPQIQVDAERIDLGKQPFERPVRATFQIRNAGTGALTLSVPRVATLLEGC